MISSYRNTKGRSSKGSPGNKNLSPSNTTMMKKDRVYVLSYNNLHNTIYGLRTKSSSKNKEIRCST